MLALRDLLGVRGRFAAGARTRIPLLLCIAIAAGSAYGALWLLAVVAGNVVLRRHYAPLVARDAKHRIARRSWALLYSLVTIQLASMLRPFVGDPEQGTRFFREAAWDNAYVIVVRTLLRLITP